MDVFFCFQLDGAYNCGGRGGELENCLHEAAVVVSFATRQLSAWTLTLSLHLKSLSYFGRQQIILLFNIPVT